MRPALLRSHDSFLNVTALHLQFDCSTLKIPRSGDSKVLLESVKCDIMQLNASGKLHCKMFNRAAPIFDDESAAALEKLL